VPEIRELRQLRDENRQLKQLVTDLSFDKTVLQESLRKKGEACAAARGGGLGARGLPAHRAAGLPGDACFAFHRALPQSPAPPGGSTETVEGARQRAGSSRLQAAPRVSSPPRMARESHSEVLPSQAMMRWTTVPTSKTTKNPAAAKKRRSQA
jgi:hypothetical protein